MGWIAVNKAKPARRVGLLVLFALLLIAASVGRSLADPPPEIPPPVMLPPPSQEGELARLPGNQAMEKALAGFAEAERHAKEELARPAAMREREASQDLYSESTGDESEELLSATFRKQLQALNAEPARFYSAARLIHVLGTSGALIESEGRKELIEGSAPVSTVNTDGLPGTVDLALERVGNAYRSQNPLVAVSVPSSTKEPVRIGNHGLAVSQAGAAEVSARRYGAMNIFYPEVQPDTDLLVSPTASGVELFDQLRSEASPEVLRFQMQMPEGAQLRSDATDAEVIAADGSKIADIPPPSAVDAQGAPVPVEMEVDRDSLVLTVRRSADSFAYPILVDPIIEEWYWQNWYEGYNLQALSNGAWHWNTSEGPSSSYVYGSTSCIYTCWGSGRGLYMDTPSGNLPANRWGQWSYSAPNAETYLANAWVSPFWRDNHVNCSQSQYGQPYDYDGMWNETSWNRLLYNEANYQGWSDIESWGRAFIVGMGTSSGISIPCWRDVMAGGTRIWLEDWSRPTLTTSSSGQWMDKTPIRLNVSAFDAGLGVHKFLAVATNASGEKQEGWTPNQCTGLYEAPCPHTWNLAEGSQPQLNYSPSSLPEGIDTLSVTAFDAAEKPSFTTNEMTLRVDHSPPTIRLTGSLTEQAKLGTELPSYDVYAEALDGDPHSTERSKARSGVVNLEFEVDGEMAGTPFTPECAGEPNCGAYKELRIEASALKPGKHVLKVKAKDAYGHSGVAELTFTTGDSRPPSLNSNGLPGGAFQGHLTPSPAFYASAFGSGGQFGHPADIARSPGGKLWVVDQNNNRLERFSEAGEYLSTIGSADSANGGFDLPCGVAVDASGNIWVADSENNRIEEFSHSMQYLAQFGTFGSESGQLRDPTALALDSHGNIWVADTENNRIEEFSAAGEYLSQFGTYGGASGQLRGPYGISIDSHDHIWVADTGNDRLQEFNEGGEVLRIVGSSGTGNGQFRQPLGIDIGPGDNVWVTDSKNGRIQKFNDTGEYVSQFGASESGEGQFAYPTSLTVDPSGDVWVIDPANSRVEAFSESGKFLTQFGSAGSGEGQFSFSTPVAGIAADPEGHLWITDPGNNRVQEWNAPPRGYASAFGSAGSGPGQFNLPGNIAVDRSGNVWVADTGNDRIQVFSPVGTFRFQFGSPGSGPGQLNRPSGLALDSEGNVWVADTGNNRIQEFRPTGQYLFQFGSGQVHEPSDLSFDSHDYLWVADTANNRVDEFLKAGLMMRTVGSLGTGNGQFRQPVGIDVGPGDKVWVTDREDGRVEEFNDEGAYLSQFGTWGSKEGQLANPSGLAVDPSGDVWVIDTANSRVEAFSESGKFLAQFGSAGSGPGQFKFPAPMAGIAADSKGHVFVTDPGNSRVEEWNTGVATFAAAFGSYRNANGQFKSPSSVATDAQGHVWITDTGDNRVEEFSEAGNFMFQFGSQGSGDGHFSKPDDIQIDAKGNVWVADAGNGRIEEFTPGGKFMKVVGSKGTGEGQIGEEVGIDAGPKGELWVADTANNRIEEFNESGEFVREWQGSGEDEFKPGAIEVDAKGEVWVGDLEHHRVEEFTEDGEYVGAFGSDGAGSGQLSLSAPMGMTSDSKGDIWITDPGNNRVETWTIPTYVPRFDTAFGAPGTGNGQFNHPAGVALDRTGNLWVIDKGNNRIEHFSRNGGYLGSIGEAGAGVGQLSAPSALAVDSSGNVWVADTANSRIEEFSEAGEYLTQFGPAVEMTAPRSLAITPSGHILVGDGEGSSQRLREFTQSGQALATIAPHGAGAGQVGKVAAVTTGPGGTIWVADSEMNRVEVFSADGSFLRQFGSTGTAGGQFNRPGALAVDENGYLWVVDEGNNRVEVFNQAGNFVSTFGVQGSADGHFSFGEPGGIAADAGGHVWIADSTNARVQEWSDPSVAVGGHLEPLELSATDSGFGVTSLALELVGASGETQLLKRVTRSCPAGTCSLSTELNNLDFSEEPPGVYTLVAVATDGAGNISEESHVFFLEAGPPRIALSGTLAERANQPLNTSSADLAIRATEPNLPESGVKTINVELDHQRVATYPFDCSSSCQEVSANFRYSAERDGAKRSIQDSPEPNGAALTSFSNASCVSVSECDAVGYYQNSASKVVTLAETWNGTDWQVQATPNPSEALESTLEDVSCTTATDCFAVGSYKVGTEASSTLVEHWNGTEWTIASTSKSGPLPQNYLYGVSCVAANDCWAVGKTAPTAAESAAGKESRALLEHWNGSEWTLSSAAEAPHELRDVSCVSTVMCIAVSGQGVTVEKWNGDSWLEEAAGTPASGLDGILNGVSCTGAASCQAVGSDRSNGHTAPLVESWNGESWSVSTTSDPVGTIEGTIAGALTGVDCASATSCTAIGTRHTSSTETLPFVEGWDGIDWALEPVAAPSEITTVDVAGVSCGAEFKCVMVGNYGSTHAKALVEQEGPGERGQTVTVEAVDKYGNAESRSIAVDVPETPHVTPSCKSSGDTVAPAETMTASEAVATFEASIPRAVASSIPATDQLSGEEVDPSYSEPSPNLEAKGSLVEAETSISPEAGFAISGVACITPESTTSAATEARVINRDAAVFANTAPATETAIRATAGGTTVVQAILGESAPQSYSWHVDLNPGERLTKLASGILAITRPGYESEGSSEASELEAPAAAETPEVLNDAAAQLEVAEHQLVQADTEATDEVVAVMAQPWVVLREGSIMPLKITVEPDVEVPTEYTVTYELPPFEPNFVIPESVVWETSGGEGEATASILTYGHCEWRLAGNTTKSPCGQFDSAAAASYAEYWANPVHDRNPHFPDYGENNCTNFVSQVLGRGGMRFMRAGEAETAVESWWERQTQLAEPFAFITSTSWRLADVLPRHLWQYELAVIDPSNQPSGWGQGDIIAYNWYRDGIGKFNHLNFVVGTVNTPAGREPLIANSSAPAEKNYPHRIYSAVRESITNEYGREWTRVPLTVVHTIANWDEPGAKKRDPANLYNESGVFHG